MNDADCMRDISMFSSETGMYVFSTPERRSARKGRVPVLDLDLFRTRGRAETVPRRAAIAIGFPVVSELSGADGSHPLSLVLHHPFQPSSRLIVRDRSSCSSHSYTHVLYPLSFTGPQRLVGFLEKLSAFFHVDALRTNTMAPSGQSVFQHSGRANN